MNSCPTGLANDRVTRRFFSLALIQTALLLNGTALLCLLAYLIYDPSLPPSLPPQPVSFYLEDGATIQRSCIPPKREIFDYRPIWLEYACSLTTFLFIRYEIIDVNGTLEFATYDEKPVKECAADVIPSYR